jgi:hypothetical protein
VRIRALQFFFSLAFFFSAARALLAGLSLGQIYALRFVDVDGNTLLTADGHVTVVVLTTQSNIDQARGVGDRARLLSWQSDLPDDHRGQLPEKGRETDADNSERAHARSSQCRSAATLDPLQ